MIRLLRQRFSTLIANPLFPIIQADIQKHGSITFPAFWQKCLLHEQHGYYMKRDVFNKRGDFVTSVEISQMFSEMIAIWIIYALQRMGVLDEGSLKQQRKFHLLEFGPGLGTLQCEIVKVLEQFELLNDLQITFIEQSDFMRQKQQENVVKALQKAGVYVKYEYQDKRVERFTSERVQLRWFKQYEQMLMEDYGDTIIGNKPMAPVPIVALAHEFFDALPVHWFQYDGVTGWGERTVVEERGAFRFHVSKTENIEKILKPSVRFSKEVTIKDGDMIEVNAQGAVIANSLAEVISKVGGAALIIDYGENHSFANSVRAIANHTILPSDDILNKPGLCDLSAYVDFSALGAAAQKVPGIAVSQVMPQGLWLESMGINARLEVLCKQANLHQEKHLVSQVDRLVKHDQMGEIFKFMCISNKSDGQLFPFIEETQQIYY